MATVTGKDTAATNAAPAIDLAERIESLKIGSLGALTAAVLYLLAGSLPLHWLTPRLATVPPLNLSDWHWLSSGAIVGLSGFLFGVTYRYIIRQDQNPHLRSGAVLAFGLVRGLAQIDTGITCQDPLVLLVLAAASVLLFAVLRVVLDGAIGQGWIKPFGISTEH